jgi:hypothetical protein
MNEYMTLIMAAAFVIVLSVAIKLLSGISLHKKDKKQRQLDFSRTRPELEQPQHEHEMVAGGRR